ncbi:MAG: hypothetical protein KAT66_00505 [Candidatus Lokiarchaeota archaeon]|nr:hypothetical protein [Candidatus Lokiarchaeota archaeon]
MNKELSETAQQALEVLKKITVIKETIIPFEEELDVLKTKLTREMGDVGVKKLELEEGTVTLVAPKDRESLEKEKIALALGINNLSEYTKYTPAKKYSKITLKKVK